MTHSTDEGKRRAAPHDGVKALLLRRSTMLRAAALLTLGIGFVSLSGGSVTAAPLLLVIAYLILIPAMILA